MYKPNVNEYTTYTYTSARGRILRPCLLLIHVHVMYMCVYRLMSILNEVVCVMKLQACTTINIHKNK